MELPKSDSTYSSQRGSSSYRSSATGNRDEYDNNNYNHASRLTEILLPPKTKL
jgi:hypothetical protein